MVVSGTLLVAATKWFSCGESLPKPQVSRRPRFTQRERRRRRREGKRGVCPLKKAQQTYADSQSLRWASACLASRSVRGRGVCSTGASGCLLIRSACVSQSSSSQASGVLLFFGIATKRRYQTNHWMLAVVVVVWRSCVCVCVCGRPNPSTTKGCEVVYSWKPITSILSLAPHLGSCVAQTCGDSHSEQGVTTSKVAL